MNFSRPLRVIETGLPASATVRKGTRMKCIRFIRFVKAMMKTPQPDSPPGLHDTRHHDATNPEQATAQESWNRQWGYYALVLLFAICLLAGYGVVHYYLQVRLSGEATITANLKRFALAYKIYANESPGQVYPPVAEYIGVWVPDLRELYPKYIENVELLIDPQAPPQVRMEMEAALTQEPPDYERAMRMMAKTYVYHGWSTRDAKDVAEIRRFHIAGGPRDSVITTEDGDNIHRLNEDIYRGRIIDINKHVTWAMAQSTIPVMIARPQLHQPEGGPFTFLWRHLRARMSGARPPLYVPTLFQDGHVEFVPLDEAPSNIKAMLELFPEPPPNSGGSSP